MRHKVGRSSTVVLLQQYVKHIIFWLLCMQPIYCDVNKGSVAFKHLKRFCEFQNMKCHYSILFIVLIWYFSWCTETSNCINKFCLTASLLITRYQKQISIFQFGQRHGDSLEAEMVTVRDWTPHNFRTHHQSIGLLKLVLAQGKKLNFSCLESLKKSIFGASFPNPKETLIEPRNKPGVPYFPLNPGWLLGILISWFMKLIIPI